MNKSICTVKDAWMEYQHGGCNSNGFVQPPLRELEANLGPKWRGPAKSATGKYFSRRKPFYEVMEFLIEKGESENSSITLLSQIMEEKCGNSLMKLSNYAKTTLMAEMAMRFNGPRDA